MASTVRGEPAVIERPVAGGAGRQVTRSGVRVLAPPLVLMLALAAGAYLRLIPAAAAADFPVNDGGLFWRMIEELRQNGYRLPATTEFNRWGLPFAYPPLGFYLVAALADLTGISSLELLRVVPAVLSWCAIPAFFLLARRLLPDATMAAVATFIFAALPRTWLWFVMGGGITRSLGFLFVLLLLHRVHVMLTDRRMRDLALAAAFGALAVASHLESAWFGVYSSALLLAAYGRSWRGLRDALLVAAGVALLAAPWWGTVVATHGLEPFRRALGSGGGEEWSLAPLAYFRFTDEAFLGVLGTLGLIGALVEGVRGRLLLPVWLGIIFVVNPRNPATPAMVPFAMLAAVAILGVLVPGLRAAFANEETRELWAKRFAPGLAVALVLVPITAYILLSSRSVAGNSPLLRALAPQDREAMTWVTRSTPPDMRALLVTGSWFGADAASEWFPALTERQSVATVQASEWLPGGQFYARWEQADSLLICTGRDVRCVERWARTHGRDYTHLYVRGMALPSVGASAMATPGYELLFRNDSVMVFARPAAAAPAAGR